MKKDIVTTEIIVKENKVGILRVGNVNYISLTDLAKFKNDKNDLINFHKPHPGNIIKSYIINQIIEKLERNGLI